MLNIHELPEDIQDYIGQLRWENGNVRRKNKELRDAIDQIPRNELPKYGPLRRSIDRILAVRSSQELQVREPRSDHDDRQGEPPTTSRRREVRRHPAAPKRPNIQE